ncbi:hypothetical protein GGI25_004923 [Coemansia spiralis]|uniref:Mediator of RNA polymerase II transcription subunit 9 n=2 Tax=Coemansia TaxID=4863 RepID=A0A9W8G3J9_9FUNG|nr:hypothetical protein EDC05_005188 [Coemansia umbellata]KAJ2622426.1 hypothetical protein GGI26_003289 [Coemansia sp. RSA 1358]KAJ2672880.1 hypothetical protein GGI25_004923 [Coemansia spiralis]
MERVFDKLDKQVETALQTLFPPTDGSSASDAQHRAQEFANQVAVVHAQLADIKRRIEETPNTDNSPVAALKKEITDLRQDISKKNKVLDKHRGILNGFVARLNVADAKNRKVVEGIDQDTA